ncbi:MAG TPA: chemotaxis protein CheD [Caulobacter sp.]|nr:chemotaxis protein CheD [Caulobacter sp.]
MSVLADEKHHIVQGEYFVSDDPRAVVSTILGSCVAACMRDPVAGIGGMNHFLLPGEGGQEGLRYGAYAMELLVNGLLQRGARRDRLEAKLFGGGRLLKGLTDIGGQNADFAERFLQDEGIAYEGGSLRGEHARRIQFWPATGRVRQQRLVGDATVFAVEGRPPARRPLSGDIEMFDDPGAGRRSRAPAVSNDLELF